MKNLITARLITGCAVLAVFIYVTGLPLSTQAAFVLPPTGPTNNTSGLALWWPFDTGSGTTAADSSGNGYTGTLYSGSTWVSGIISNGLSFNAGTGDYLAANGPASALNGLGSATLCAWVRTTSGFTVGFNDIGGSRFSIESGGGTVYWQVEKGSASYPSCAFSPDSNWHWFALCYNNASPGLSSITAYIDGVAQTLTSGGANPGASLAANLGSFSVAHSGANFAYYSMNCDDVRIYNRALSYDEITNQFQWPQGRDVASGTAALITTYYIDYSTGSDANNGTTRDAPWQHHPFMHGFTGSYKHQPGDHFIFRGGVTWPNSCFTLYVASGGAGNTMMDYYGSTNSWFAGANWTRPVFDAGGIPVTNGGNNFVLCNVNNVIFDNLELTHFYWDSGHQGYGVGCFLVGGATNVEILNCYLHSWSHDTAANGCVDNMQCITGSTTTLNPGCVCSNCVFDGSPNGTDSAQSLYCFPVAQNCVFQNMVCGPLQNGNPCIMSGCTVGPLNVSFSGRHGAGFEPQGPTGTQYCFNNIFHDCSELNINIGGAAGPTGVAYIYNNIVYNSGPGCILLKYCAGAANTAYIWNNFLDSSRGGSYAILEESGPWTYLAEQNNLEVTGGSSGSFMTLVRDHNIALSASQVTSFTKYQSSALRFNPSALLLVGSGTNLTGLGMLTSDMMGYPRPKNGNWDIGPYCLRPTWKLP